MIVNGKYYFRFSSCFIRFGLTVIEFLTDSDLFSQIRDKFEISSDIIILILSHSDYFLKIYFYYFILYFNINNNNNNK